MGGYWTTESLERYPVELYDESSIESGVWLRADAMTRGKARADCASLVGCDFLDIQITVEHLKPYSDPEFPTAMAVCGAYDQGACKYWVGRYR